MSMATTRSTFTLDSELAERARQLNINISAAAREGVAAAVRTVLADSDRSAYERNPEQPDPFWDAAEVWNDDDAR
jgi:hypothetical protein